ncbi:MAG: phenylalanine--tRNA ligase subunit beta, partial [Longimicrobiales bacterium]
LYEGTSPRRGGVEARVDELAVRIAAPERCPRYTAAVIHGVRVAPSPGWLAARLRAVGLRPINNVVDVTNYVLYELGQPLHAFDLQRLEGGQIVVRTAVAGETLVTLDGDARELTADMLVIADAQRPVALAGVMGGRDSEVTEATHAIVLECALFEPRSVRSTRRALGMNTEATYRFERGVDPEGLERALRRAVALIQAIATDDARSPDMVDVCARPWHANELELRLERAAHVLGMRFEAEQVVDLLEPIGFQHTLIEDGRVRFRVPGHRAYDVAREIDLIEEVARRRGYQAFPETLRPFRPSAVPDDPMAALHVRVRNKLVGRGLVETRTAPFAPEAFGEVALQLPLSAEESRLRSALLPGLLRGIEHNWARGTRDIRLFEIGTVFFETSPDAPPGERTRLALVLSGARTPPHWESGAADLDLWDLKGEAEALAALLGHTLEPAADASLPGFAAVLDPARRFALRDAAREIRGAAGAVRAEALDAPRWAAPVWALEVELVPGMAQPAAIQYRALPDYPATERDLALLLPDGLAASRVQDAVRESAGPLLESVRVFDLYRGAGIPAGTRSVAFNLRFRAANRTLTDAEVDDALGRVLEHLQEELGVERR